MQPLSVMGNLGILGTSGIREWGGNGFKVDPNPVVPGWDNSRDVQGIPD